jgi:hypothetical protein
VKRGFLVLKWGKALKAPSLRHIPIPAQPQKLLIM